jgi:hypothetical protein
MGKNKVFISHASGDYRDINGRVIPGNAISEIIKVLDDNHIERWIDEYGLISTKGWCQQIEDAINECNIFLYIASERANASANTANEIAYAITHKKHIIPVKLDKSDYHKDIRLNLIRIHFLKYYEDREKTLRDLVTTIKNIKTDVVIVDTSVTLKKIPNEQKINNDLLSEKVLSLFNSKNIKSSAENFTSLIKILNCDSETGYKTLNKYIVRLQNLSEERNYNVRRSRIERLVSDIKEDGTKTERIISIVIILLKMYLYFCLDDISEVLFIQKEVNKVKFELSYIEKNAETINEAANLTVRGAIFAAGFIAAITGKGGSTAKASMIASTKGEKITIVKTPQKIAIQKRTFETFKTVVENLIFIKN